MRVELNLHADIPDIVELIEVCLVLGRSQSHTERVGKTAKLVIQDRFEGKHDECRTRTNAQDRARKEVFIRENQGPVRDGAIRS